MGSLWQGLLSVIYPSKCGICHQLGPEPICETCRNGFRPLPDPCDVPEPLTEIVACYLYDGSAATAIKNLKFGDSTVLAEPLSAILWERAQRELSGRFDLVVPVPIARSRRATRGFNQSELLCSVFPKDIVRPDLLKRTRYTRPQVGLGRDDRLQQLSNAFSARNIPSGARILLVDDLITSGGTAIECARELLAKGASEVRLLTLASQPLA